MPESSAFSSGTAFKNLILAAFLAALIVLLARAGTLRLLATEAPKEAIRPTVTIETSAPSPEEEIHQARLARLAREKQEQQAQATEEAKRAEKLQKALAEREVEKERATKEAAWQRFYKKPKKCDNPNDNSLIVECGNHFIREQQRFEKLYAAGKN